MIPKLLHQTYKNNDIPDLYKYCASELRILHPDYEYCFYTDAKMMEIMETEFPDYIEEFNRLPRMIMKIDMFRYFLMYKYGGIYADMDYLFMNSFPYPTAKIVLPASREENGVITRLGNCVFASEAGHPFWKTLMDTLFLFDRAALNHDDDAIVDGHPQGTGPVFVTEMWKRYADRESIRVPPRDLFHPPTKVDQTYVNGLRESGTIGMHFCSGLWRENRL